MFQKVSLIILLIIITACSGSNSGGSSFDSSVTSTTDELPSGGGAGGGTTQTATPVISISSPSDNNRRATGSTGSSFSIVGSCTYLGGEITISDGGSISQTTSCGSGGTFSTTIDFTAVADGTYNLTVTQTNDNSVSDAAAVTIENIANYCTAGRIASVNFANTGEGGIDGLSSANAFTICTVAQFNYLDDYITANPGGGYYFTLMEHLDFGGGAPDAIDLGSNTFDGNYLTLEDVVMTSATHPDHAIFGEDWSTASDIQNIHLKDMTMTITTDSAGGGFLLQIAYAGTVIQNITGENLTITKNYDHGPTNFQGFGSIIGQVDLGVAVTISDISVDSVTMDLGGSGAGYGTSTIALVGGIIGHHAGTGDLDNMTVSNSTISGDSEVGGVVGRIDSATVGMDNANVTATTINLNLSSAGGVVGDLAADTTGTFNDIHFTGTINGLDTTNINVGGLIGYARGSGGGSLTNSSATWTFPSANYDVIGGLVGQAKDMIISTSYADVTITSAGDYIGGLVGTLEGTNTITDCYATGTITTSGSTDDVIGGLFGFDNWSLATATLQRVFFNGTITNSGGAQIHQIGLGDANPVAVVSCTSDCYYNSTNNGFGYTGIAGVTGLTDSQMQVKSNMAGIDASGNWKMDSSVSLYPVLSWQ